MNPIISDFPSRRFYSSLLLNGALKPATPDITRLSHYLHSTNFIDLQNSRERISNSSKLNKDEARITLSLIKCLVYLSSNIGPNSGLGTLSGKIGVVTPYKSQVLLLRRKIEKWLTKIHASGSIEIDTIDAF